MKIKVKSEGVNIFIPIPTSLFYSPITRPIGFRMTNKWLRENMEKEIAKKDFKKMAEALKLMKKKYKKLDLIEVYSAKGDIVKITL